jgi:hypothetical protein
MSINMIYGLQVDIFRSSPLPEFLNISHYNIAYLDPNQFSYSLDLLNLDLSSNANEHIDGGMFKNTLLEVLNMANNPFITPSTGFPFFSPFTTRGATVEVFKPASTRGTIDCRSRSRSRSHITTDDQSASSSYSINHVYINIWEQAMSKGDNRKIRSANCDETYTDVELRYKWRWTFMSQIHPTNQVRNTNV